MPSDDSTSLAVTVTTNARRSEILGWTDGRNGEKALRVKIAAPPRDGKANQVLVSFIARQLRVPKKNVTFKSGETSRVKRLEVTGITWMEILEKLEVP